MFFSILLPLSGPGVISTGNGVRSLFSIHVERCPLISSGMRHLGQIITTYSMVTIRDGHHATLCCTCLLLYCHNSNKKSFVHHSILIHLADLLGETSRQTSHELAVIQPYLPINVGSCYPVLPLLFAAAMCLSYSSPVSHSMASLS